jgi:pyruvate/2-oxoglutarate/acetoin dehydrogenase E1 component
MKFGVSLNEGLREILNNDNKIVLLGEDIGFYGGAFGITKGLQNEYPDRVIQTPMSESALTSICVGVALNGYKPILEIMFGDFITLWIN